MVLFTLFLPIKQNKNKQIHKQLVLLPKVSPCMPIVLRTSGARHC